MTIINAPHLFGKYWDPLIAIGLGTASYYIYERRHRTANSQTLLLTKLKTEKKDL